MRPSIRSRHFAGLRRAATAAVSAATFAILINPALAAQQDRTGREAATADQARERVAEFIRETGVASGETPAARWVHPVCPRVLGLQAQAAATAEARIRAIAEQVGAEVAPEPCNSNIVVTFAANPAAVVREVRRMRGRIFADVAPTRRDELLTSDAPVRWWYVTQTVGRFGEGEREPGTTGQGQPAAYSPNDGVSYAFEGDMMHYDSSLISTYSSRVLASASVVIDQQAVMGRRLGDVAAYAALVALAEIRSDDYSRPDSILGMFGAPDRSAGLTGQDLAFLRALYRLPLDRQASRHRGLLAREMLAARSAD